MNIDNYSEGEQCSKNHFMISLPVSEISKIRYLIYNCIHNILFAVIEIKENNILERSIKKKKIYTNPKYQKEVCLERRFRAKK